jgi:hypothetical protein
MQAARSTGKKMTSRFGDGWPHRRATVLDICFWFKRRQGGSRGNMYYLLLVYLCRQALGILRVDWPRVHGVFGFCFPVFLLHLTFPTSPVPRLALPERRNVVLVTAVGRLGFGERLNADPHVSHKRCYQCELGEDIGNSE